MSQATAPLQPNVALHLPHAHPDRLAAVATLFGMRPAPIQGCRLLELGCGAGENLLPLAERYPEARFVGIDWRRGPTSVAEQLADRLQIANVELRHLPPDEWASVEETFDYVICRDVFSRVTPPQQDQLLSWCGKRLSEQGVAYVNHDVYPGWHLRSVVRDLWQRFDPSERPAKARPLASFLHTALAQRPTPFARQLRSHAEALLGPTGESVRRGELDNQTQPSYFFEFVDRAASARLEYLGDAPLATMFVSNLGTDVEQQIRWLAGDVISVEQHLDVLRERLHRETLLCRDSVQLARQVRLDSLEKLFVYARLRPHHDSTDLTTDANEEFSDPDGRTIASSVPLLKAALFHLAAQWPRAVPVPELIASAQTASGQTSGTDDGQRQYLLDTLARFIAMGMVEITSEPDRFTGVVSQRPRACRIARLQSLSSPVVINRRHQRLTLDAHLQNVIKYLDGQHDHEALLNKLVAAVEQGDASMMVGGLPATGGAEVTDALRDTLERCLTRLANNALLVA